MSLDIDITLLHRRKILMFNVSKFAKIYSKQSFRSWPKVKYKWWLRDARRWCLWGVLCVSMKTWASFWGVFMCLYENLGIFGVSWGVTWGFFVRLFLTTLDANNARIFCSKPHYCPINRIYTVSKEIMFSTRVKKMKFR